MFLYPELATTTGMKTTCAVVLHWDEDTRFGASVQTRACVRNRQRVDPCLALPPRVGTLVRPPDHLYWLWSITNLSGPLRERIQFAPFFS